MTILEPPYDKTEADFLRKQAQAQIWACWWCLNFGPPSAASEARGKSYWPSEMLKPVGHKFACPKHLQENEALRAK